MTIEQATTWGDVPTAAKRKNVSIASMRRYITAGLVYAERVGPKLIRVDLSSVDAMGTPLQYRAGEPE